MQVVLESVLEFVHVGLRCKLELFEFVRCKATAVEWLVSFFHEILEASFGGLELLLFLDGPFLRAESGDRVGGTVLVNFGYGLRLVRECAPRVGRVAL